MSSEPNPATPADRLTLDQLVAAIRRLPPGLEQARAVAACEKKYGGRARPAEGTGEDHDALFPLHPKQREVYESPATELFFGGAAGPGKSHALRALAIRWCDLIPGLQVYLFRRKYPDLDKNHMQGPHGFPALLAPWVQSGKAKIVENEIRIGKSRIFLCHCEYEKNVYNYQGAEMHVLMIDELTHFSETMYRYLRSRVRAIGMEFSERWRDFFPRVVAASNPGGLGHNWVKAAFISPKPPMEIWRTPASEGGMLRQFIPARMEDNPSLTRDDPEYEGRLDGLGNPSLVRAMKGGDWDIEAGGMFDDLWRREIHVLPPFPIPKSWHLDRAFDWGSSHPFALGWWAEADGTDAFMADGKIRSFPRGTLFQVAEWYGWNGRPNEGCRMLASEIGRGIVEKEHAMVKPVGRELPRVIHPGPADSSIFNEENGHSIADDFRRAGVVWKTADKTPGSRIAGAEAFRKRLKASMTFPLEGPGIFFFDEKHCPHSIRTIPALPRSPRNEDDVDTDAEDHCWDMVRYRILSSRGTSGSAPRGF